MLASSSVQLLPRALRWAWTDDARHCLRHHCTVPSTTNESLSRQHLVDDRPERPDVQTGAVRHRLLDVLVQVVVIHGNRP